MTPHAHLRGFLGLAPRRAHSWALALSLVVSASTATGGGRQAAERIRPAPRYRAGQTLHYQIDFRTHTSSHTAGAVTNPQGASQLDLSANLLLRLDVLSTLPASADDSGNASLAAGQNKTRRARMRATYEKSAVVVRGDSYDPAVADLEKQYRKLEGRAVEFTLEADGKIEEVTGLDKLLDDPRAAAAIRGWLAQLATGTEFPAEGIAPGQTWSKDTPLVESPLAGTVLHSSSTYARNEICRDTTAADSAPRAKPEIGAAPALAPPAAAEPPEQCAVIVTRSEMKQEGNSKNGQTPDALRLHGLRSSGTWTSVGESLAYLSLATGLTMSVTQSGADEMNMSIVGASGGQPIHYTTQTRSETHVTLLPEVTRP